MMLLIGADSEIGAATLRRMNGDGQPVHGTTRRAGCQTARTTMLDLSQPLNNWAPPAETRAACILAAVARLAVCAGDPVGSAHVNVTQTLTLIDRLLADRIYVLFLSTNQVFDGTVPHVPPYAPRAPVSEYGRQKAMTESAIDRLIEEGAPVAVLRLSKVVSPEMPLIRDWARALASSEPIRSFSDMMMAPVPVALASEAISSLMRAQERGIFQLTGPADVSYADVGRFISERIGAAQDLVEPVPAASAGAPEGATPHHTTLDSTLLSGRFGITAPDPWAVIDSIIERVVRRCGPTNA